MQCAPRGILVALLLTLAAAPQATSGQAAQPAATIEAMVEAADPGATVRIPPGVYHGHLRINRPVVLDGQDLVVFDGLGTGTVIEVLAEDVTIRRCTIRGSGDDVTGEPAAIRVTAGRATVEQNVIEDALFGIDLSQASGSVVRHNTIRCKDMEPGRRGDGIRLWWSHECTVEDNIVRGSRDMVFWYSENLRVSRNRVSDSRYGLHFMYSHDTVLSDNELDGNSVGVYLMYSNRITLSGNRMLNNRGASGYGIGLKDCDDITLNNNAILANRVGVYVDNSPSSIDSVGLFDSNIVAFNEIGLLATPNTHDNVFTQNIFVENEEAATTHGRGFLTNNTFSLDGIGNYWSDYAGFDLDSDGIGDIPYEPRSLFGAMLAREPNLRLFIHSPAQRAIEFTARALPELRPQATLVDRSPLVRPPAVGLPGPDERTPVGWVPVLALTLTTLPVGLVLLLGRESSTVAVVGGRPS